MLKRNVAYFGLNLLGIVACIYSLHVEISKANDKGYVAMCDLSYRASCSKVVTSEYVRPGNLFFFYMKYAFCTLKGGLLILSIEVCMWTCVRDEWAGMLEEVLSLDCCQPSPSLPPHPPTFPLLGAAMPRVSGSSARC